MKNKFDTYTLYTINPQAMMNCRFKFTMKDEIDAAVMEKAANDTMPRFPYFAVKVKLNSENSYELIPNSAPVVVVPETAGLPAIGSEAVNRHLLFISYSGKEVYFNINHTFGMGTSFFSWAASVLYQYVTLKYQVSLNCPNIFKPGSSLTEDELWEPALENIPEKEANFIAPKCPHFYPTQDYVAAYTNPSEMFLSYYAFTFDQKNFMDFAKANNHSVTTLLISMMFKALARIVPAEPQQISVSVSTSSAKALGHPLAHNFLVRELHINFDRDQAESEMAELGNYLKEQMSLQLDEANVVAETRRLINYFNGIDEQKSLEDKNKYALENSAVQGKDAYFDSFIVSYLGNMDLGDLSAYIDSYYLVSDGHLMFEATAMDDEIYLAFQQVIKDTKYVDAFKSVLNEYGISYKVEGPFSKNLPSVELPEK